MTQTVRAKRRVFLTQQSLNGAIKGVCDVLRRSNCAGAMQYIPELTWILFLRILDDQEGGEGEHLTKPRDGFAPSIRPPYRWRDWGAPYEPLLAFAQKGEKPHGWKRRELENAGSGSFLAFVNGELFPYLKSLGKSPDATARQRIIAEIASNIERTRIDAEYNLREVLDKVHGITVARIDPKHIFPLSQIYEGLLLRMGQKSNDGGQFFTPREVVRAMVRVVAPQIGETIYDPCCGTGGFLAQAYEHIRQGAHEVRGASEAGDKETNYAFYGREKENLVYPLALANLVLHGVDEPHIWHGNTLTGREVYGGLFKDAPSHFDVILTNPPFGGKESKEAQAQFSYKSSSTQLLFLQHVIDSLTLGGRCGIVVDEGTLFRTTDTAFVQTKRRLLDTCDLWCIVSLPIGAFVNAGASVKTDILFFTRGRPTDKIWYYDLSDVKTTKAAPLTGEHFERLFALLPTFAPSDRSWSVTRRQIEENGYDLKAVNPNFRVHQEARSLDDLLGLMQKVHQEIRSNFQALSEFQRLRDSSANAARACAKEVSVKKRLHPRMSPR